MDTGEAFSRIWAAFEAGEILPACAWCRRVRIDGAWLLPPRAAFAAIDERHTFSHSICDACVEAYASDLEEKTGRSGAPAADTQREPHAGCCSP